MRRVSLVALSKEQAREREKGVKQQDQSVVLWAVSLVVRSVALQVA
jgi:hypothetical protein